MSEWMIAEVGEGLRLRLVAGDSGIRAIEFRHGEMDGVSCDSNPLLQETAAQLKAYFQGKLREFDIPLELRGTAFQKRVWVELQTIPYGAVRSYSQLAESIGEPKAVRAVGAANGSNPLPIVVPCHRVIGASGKLVGYGGGLPLKKRLLELESGTVRLVL